MRPLHSSLIGAALVGLIIDVVVCSAQPPEAPATDAFPTLQGPYFGETPPGAGPLELDPDGADAAALLERLVRRKPAG